MEFKECAKMAGFCSAGHILYTLFLYTGGCFNVTLVDME